MYSVIIYTVKRCYYSELNVVSMSVMGFQKKIWMAGGWVDGVNSI